MKQTRETPQRKLVREIVNGHLDHPTADEIYERARKKNPHISRGTVYRNLGLLAENGEIRRLTMPLGPDHFDAMTDDHYHFVCRGCNKVVDAGIPYRSEFNGMAPTLPGYQTEWHRLILVGLCASCQKGQKGESH